MSLNQSINRKPILKLSKYNNKNHIQHKLDIKMLKVFASPQNGAPFQELLLLHLQNSPLFDRNGQKATVR